MRRIETFDWWKDLVALKDELSLRELAERFDVTPGAISAAMKREGLSRKPAPPGPRSRRSGPLPPEPGEESAARKPGRTADKLAPYAGRLGTVPDSVIAREAGMTPRAVAAYRARNGISGFTGGSVPKAAADSGSASGSTGRRSRIDPFAHLLGTVPDRVVAEQAGVSLNAVRNYRVKKAIPAAGRGRPRSGSVPTTLPKAPAAAAPAAAAAEPPATAVAPAPAAPRRKATGEAVAYSVELTTGETVIVAATTLAEAAVSASSAGEVISMRRLGRFV